MKDLHLYLTPEQILLNKQYKKKQVEYMRNYRDTDEYRAKNAEYMKKYRDTDEYRAKNAEYRKKNSEKLKEQKKEQNRRAYLKRKEAAKLKHTGA